jgi:hypothetical protein
VEEFLSPSLDGSTMNDSLIGVVALGRLIAAEELIEELLHLENTSEATNVDDLMKQ